MALVLLILSGCSDKKQEGLHFFNDFEAIQGWVKAPTIPTLAKGTAYSGNFALRLDSVEAFSHAFQLKFKDISSKPLRKVKFSVFVMFTNPNAQAKLVFAIDGVDKPNLLWNGLHLQDYVKEPNKWVQVSGEINLEKDGVNSRDNTAILYVWNTGKEVVFADDFDLEFFE